MKRANCRWSDQEDRHLARLVASKLSSREIGEIMGRSETSVVGRMTKLGVESRYPRGTYSKVAEKLSSGGLITVRLPKRVHENFLRFCKERRVSMNQYLLDEISKATGLD